MKGDNLVIERLKNFGLKIWGKIEDHLAGYIAAFIIVLFLSAFLLLKNWFITKYSLKMYGWTWLLLACLFLSSLIYSLISIFRGRGRFKDPKDIKSQIDDWFLDSFLYCPFQAQETISFYNLEDSLNIKKGSSINYLPILAYKHGYGFEMGKKTFKITKLTDKNSIRVILEQHLKEHFDADSKEFVIFTYEIDKKLCWPIGATEQYMKTLKYEIEEKFDLEYTGHGKVVFRLQGNGN
jgi:hypothetical protein